jgi:hypothetical protein
MKNNCAQYYSVYGITNYTGNCRNVFFYQSRIHYLGHVISSEGITMEPTKVEAIIEFLTPTSILEVRRFMVLVGYYRQFVECFSKIEKLIMKL